MSAITDAIKKSGEVRFLIECDFDGLIDRIAEVDIAVDSSHFFDGLLLNEISISTTFDIENFRYSISTVTIRRANADRFQDNEQYRQLDGGFCKIWVWSTGLTWAQIETAGLVFMGYFQKVGHTQDYFDFEISDLTKTFGVFPKALIGTDTWPNHRTEAGGGSVSGKAGQMVFGTFLKGVPLLCVDTSAYKYLATYGVSLSADADYTATTVNVYDKAGAVIDAAGYVYYFGVDGYGIACGYFDFTSDQTSNEPLSCSISGINDAVGAYGGTIVSHPADISHYILSNFEGLTNETLHLNSFKSLKSKLYAVDYASIFKSQSGTLEIIQRLLYQQQSAIVPYGGKIGVMCFDPLAQTKGYVIRDHHLIGDVSITKSTDRMLCNNLTLQFGYNHATSAYEGLLQKNRTNNVECFFSYHNYHREFYKSIACPDIKNSADAQTSASRFLSIFATRHNIVELTINYADGFDFVEGDAAYFELEELPTPYNTGTSAKGILLDKTLTPDFIKQRWWIV